MIYNCVNNLVSAYDISCEIGRRSNAHTYNLRAAVAQRGFFIGQQKRGIVPYRHCILITSSHKIKLWEESATDEAVGMQRG